MALKTTSLIRIAVYAMRAHAASQRVRFAIVPLPEKALSPLLDFPGLSRPQMRVPHISPCFGEMWAI
jgi:hypothetical protein